MKRPQTSMEGEAAHSADLELVQEILAGNEHALKLFVDRMRCVPRMLMAKNARLGRPLGPEDLEDLSQDTVVAVWRQLPTFGGRASLETWVYRFCQHAMANRMRTRQRRPRKVETDLTEEGSEEVNRALEFDHVYAALDTIGPPDGPIVHLKHFEHLTFQEIGARLAISPNTAKTRYYRGLERLKTALELSGEEVTR